MERDQGQASSPGSTQDHLHAITDEAGALLNEAKTQGAEQFEHYRDTAADQLESLQQGARSAASALQGNDSLGLSQYLGQAAECIGSFAEQIRHESAEDLLHRGTRLARDNPAMFLAGSVAIGFALSRFLRASASHTGSTSTAPTADGTREPYHSSAPTPDHSSDVSTHKPYTPVDPVGMGGATPVGGGPLERDSLKGGE
ncbi:putative phage infection (PIP) family protein YhgE [Pseudomonas hunanensis]|uniref:Phage infection (PIP) family protein YhgE n=1 Tax=Pseudomonas hunanensis TaxID=1247546 RepID=A0ACC6K2B5_9PSED|nr:hypothetical protein [Pseudomonas hunanensis]MDR6712552.1 putative phage infection (PIP) family protein YhgE [Pseudomonas hunanensis]